ncbi:4Fe-4S dicluster domain-containing protein [candidate division WOR-3 bacterium]|nr:4Fe-4S dicluster domain-containing protein [candidate division WOR-3 bacterium]
MKAFILSAEELGRLVTEWAKSGAVYAPVKVKDWSEFRRISSLAEADLTRVNTKLSARSLLFPQCETMFRFETSHPDKAQLAAEPVPQVILGVRPCDAAGIAVLDKFFAGQGETDTFYRRRRDKTILVGLACQVPDDTCFCTAVGGSPAGTRGLDLLLTDIGGHYVAEPLTERGEAAVKDMNEAAAADLAKKDELASKATAAMAERIDTRKLKELLDTADTNPVWGELSLPCVNCGACTFVCPTCHCFDITDETRKDKGARIRVWDTCQSCMYSQHASGHNPRLAPAARFRNRTMDKFRYTVDQVGEVSCVGCGRCIRECPAGIDIRETVERLMLALGEQSADAMQTADCKMQKAK